VERHVPPPEALVIIADFAEEERGEMNRTATIWISDGISTGMRKRTGASVST
jgi:hypothetical protein